MIKRNEAFERAVRCDRRNLLVIAPPGCGKTELLAHRAHRNVADLEAGRQILALTFSNKAKANLNGRLIEILGVERKRRFVVVHNFHGHSAEIIRCHGRTLGIPIDFDPPNDRTQDDVVDVYLEGLTEREANDVRARINGELGEAKRGPYSDAEVLERLRDGGDERSLLVEEHRQRSGQLFYDDLLRHAQRLLRVPQVARMYRTHFQTVMVDEFQDLSPQQLDLVLRSADCNRTIVGDPLQGIYSWAGARPVENERLLRRISGEPLTLGTSYRSSPNVLGLLGAVASEVGGRTLVPVDPEHWFEGGVAAGFMFGTGSDEAEFVRSASAEIQRLAPETTIGVICRSGWRRKPVDAAFASSDTPVTRWDLAIDDPAVVKRIHDAVARIGANASMEQLRTHLLESVNIADSETIADITEVLTQVDELVAESGSLGAALARLRAIEDATDAISPGIHLLNAHLGKGQQFDWVFVPGFDEGNMPSFLAQRPADLAEELRILLVVISRARHGVIVTGARSLISKARRPYDVKPSRWTTLLRGAMSHTSSDDVLEHVRRMYKRTDIHADTDAP
ncbi:ATP-dependent helicase [Curtobacterium sp. MCPF17_021]|uniref:UvrD-helicase domain-containing protein n=1 Tax=Curtobacterium sp. MCPF17_021 TaxID=2175639 RepID=UPI000DA909E9|nr:ATP-dependent helicase [Curtobacterium sp. MCPF17_021]WIE83358.1 ATP-dependent helicase [Curtobacterium sp. MCPF17_021]